MPNRLEELEELVIRLSGQESGARDPYGIGRRGMMYADRAKAIFEESILNGGGTYDQNGAKMEFSGGYMVATRRFPDFVIDVNDSEAAIDAILETNRQNRWGLLGTWVHEGKIYIEPVMHIENERHAREYALDYHQKAYYDVKNDKSVFV